MESIYFDTDTVPFDIWRLILKRLKTLPDLRSFNTINKGCNIASNNSIRKQKLWWSIYRSRLSSELDISSSWPSKLFQTQHAWIPPINPIFKRDDIQAIKIIIIGDGGTGKTTYANTVYGGQIQNRKYVPTIGVDILKVVYPSSCGPIEASFWDTAGPERYGLLRDHYYTGAAGAIVLCDITSRISIKNVILWLPDVRRICPNIPIVICPNKIDAEFNEANFTEDNMAINYRTVMALMQKLPDAMLCEISNKAGYQLFDPILWICRQLTGDPNLKMKFPVLKPDRQINPRIFDTMLRIKEHSLLERMIGRVDDDDEFIDVIEEIPKKEIDEAQMASEIKKAMLERVLENCSPRLHAVMSRLLRGRAGAAVSTNPYQRPTLLYIEGLECKEFYSPTQFEFLAPFMEFYGQHKNEIIEEAKKCIGLESLDPITSNISKYGAWKAFYFLESGIKINKNHELAPTVSQLLTRVNSELMTCGFGYAYLSVLAPKAHITPHCGPCNVKLRCHLPLIVPSTGDASIRVGTTTKKFMQNELLIFDDSLEHEVRNDSDELRVVLLFDIWHHQLTKEEIKSITTYFS